jgi:hypothetical protein
MGFSFTKLLPVAALLWLTAVTTPAQAQAAAKAVHAKSLAGMAGALPPTEADLKVAGDFIHDLLVSEDPGMVRNLLTANFKSYGPGNRVSTAEELIKGFQGAAKLESNRKVELVTAPVTLKTGELQGQRVLIQGVSSFTVGGKDVKVPFVCLVHVTNGKIDQSTSYYDNTEVLLANGYKLSPPAASK